MGGGGGQHNNDGMDELGWGYGGSGRRVEVVRRGTVGRGRQLWVVEVPGAATGGRPLDGAAVEVQLDVAITIHECQ